MARTFGQENSTINYYDILIIGRTGIGKSCTADKVLIANLKNRDYRGEPHDEETTEDGRMVMSDLTVWLTSDTESERVTEPIRRPYLAIDPATERVTARLKNIVFCRSSNNPHKEVNMLYTNSNQGGHMEYRLISCETTKVRVLDAPGFFETPDTAPNTATSKSLAIMREILRIQTAMRLNINRILYFIPVRGPLERPHEVLVAIELKQMVHYFGKSIFDCMVLAVTVSPDVYNYIPPNVTPYSDDVREKTRHSFELALRHVLPGEQLRSPPIIFISMHDTCEDIHKKILDAPVIYDGPIRLPFNYHTCIRCGLTVKVLSVFHPHDEEKEGLKVACYVGNDSNCIPYDESTCHPVMIKKHNAIARLFRGLSHYVSNKKNFEKLAGPDDVCACCGVPPGEGGCTKVGTFYEFNGRQVQTDHAIGYTVSTDNDDFDIVHGDDLAQISYTTHVQDSLLHTSNMDREHRNNAQIEPQPQPINVPHDGPASNELHIPNLSDVKERAHVSFLKHEILRCGHSGLHYRDKDISIIIPEGSLALDHEEIEIEVGITMSGPFNFPRNSRLISPVVWLHLKEEKELKVPFQVKVPHILNNLTNEKARYYQLVFCHSDHFSYHSGQLICEFQPLLPDLDNPVTCSFSDSYATVKMSKFCTLCLTATDKPELQSDIGYHLTTVVCTSQLRHEAYFCLSYDLGAYLQAIEEQFPEDEYTVIASKQLTFIRFPARIKFITEDNQDCTIFMEPTVAEIMASDVDIMAKNFSHVKSTPGTNTSLKMTVCMKDNVDMVRVQVNVEGSNNDEQLCTALSFPFREFVSKIEEEKHIAAVQKAMETRGKLEHTIVHGVFVGPARSGKNSIMERLLGRMPSELSPSTGVAENTVQVKVIQKSTTVAANIKDSIWSVMGYDDEAFNLMLMSGDAHILTEDMPETPQLKERDQLDHQIFSDVLFEESEEASSTSISLTNSKVAMDTKSDKEGDQPTLREEDGTQSLPNLPSSSANQSLSQINYISPIEIFKSALRTKNLKDLQQFFHKTWSLYLTNTGGQIEFQEVLPLLVSGPSVFFFTFRLDRDLSEYYDIEYQLSDGTKSKPYMSTVTTIEGILQTLASISAMGTFVYHGLQKREVPLRPKVFFVGTHKDKVDKKVLDSHIAKVDQQLQDAIKPTAHYRDIVEYASENQLMFTVNNFSESDSDFRSIRKAVERVVERDEFQMTCPAHWLIYSLVLRNLQLRTVHYEICFEIAKLCGIVNREELNDALHFIHSKMGLIRYFPYEGTKDIVIIDPQFLFDKVTELIVDTFTFEKSGKQLADQFKQKGIFSIAEFERISEKCESEITSFQFRKLLESLRIAAPFTINKERKLFFPCVLAHTSKSKKKPITGSTKVPPLIVSFECGYCPKGVTGALINYLMANEMESTSKWILVANEIYKDQISFHVGLYDTIVINIWPTHFEINCIPDPQFKTKERKHCPVEEICSEVREAIDTGIKQIFRDMNYISSQHSLTFPCKAPGCKGSHPAELLSRGNKHSLRCDRVGKLFKVPRNLYVWGIGKECVKEPSDCIAAISSNEQCTTLTSQHHAILLEQLNEHSAKWKSIGLQLGFRQSELDAIEARPLLLVGAPNTMLSTLLTEWLEWAPGDSRGGSSFATLEGLKNALMKVNLGATAHNLHISPN